ncbi:MAG: polyribonucleotide nucleotidyltransferase, partial [bacterium]
GVSRREIGHGKLGERALEAVLPPWEEFTYTIRVVSEILESNGSSSMATVCAGSLALMDAGVPIRKAVAGIAMGLVMEGEKYAILTDILGDEDHLGDMDFKVAGTRDGITAFQMDIKLKGISPDVMAKALTQARDARHYILDIMDRTLEKPRSYMSPYAPKFISLKIPPDRIGALIGPGGKNIRAIIQETGATIDIADDGTVRIGAVDAESGEKAKAKVEEIAAVPEVGKVYRGTVKRITDFGAFVEILPGVEGLMHVSQIDNKRVERVSDYFKVGDKVDVKLLKVDPDGKLDLSHRALLVSDTQQSKGSFSPESSASSSHRLKTPIASGYTPFKPPLKPRAQKSRLDKEPKKRLP